VYELPATAHFDVYVYEDGQLFDGGCLGGCVSIEAFFPDPQTLVELEEIYLGVYTFDPELLSPGEKTLTVVVRRDFLNAIEELQALASQIEEKIVRLEEQLAGETDPLRIRALKFIISMLEDALARLYQRIAILEAPLALGAKTITVLPAQLDTTPPEYGEYVPPLTNGHRGTSDPFASVSAEVIDVESGIDMVLLYIDGSSTPELMTYDGTSATYTPTEAWNEGGHHVLLVATDNAGNEAELAYNFVADWTAPQLDSFEPTQTSDVTPLIKVVVSDSGVFVNSVTMSLGKESVTFTAGGLQTLTVSLQIRNPLPLLVPQTVYIEADDMVGNVMTETREITVVP
jgi:hypothetical protein